MICVTAYCRKLCKKIVSRISARIQQVLNVAEVECMARQLTGEDPNPKNVVDLNRISAAILKRSHGVVAAFASASSRIETTRLITPHFTSPDDLPPFYLFGICLGINIAAILQITRPEIAAHRLLAQHRGEKCTAFPGELGNLRGISSI